VPFEAKVKITSYPIHKVCLQNPHGVNMNTNVRLLLVGTTKSGVKFAWVVPEKVGNN